MALQVRPLHDRVLVRRREQEDKTKGGIYLPSDAKEKPISGEVLAVGPGKLLDTGSRAELDVKVGDVVLFGKYAGNEVKLEEEELLVLREEDIMGVITGR